MGPVVGPGLLRNSLQAYDYLKSMSYSLIMLQLTLQLTCATKPAWSSGNPPVSIIVTVLAILLAQHCIYFHQNSAESHLRAAILAGRRKETGTEACLGSSPPRGVMSLSTELPSATMSDCECARMLLACSLISYQIMDKFHH